MNFALTAAMMMAVADSLAGIDSGGFAIRIYFQAKA
jgi:hypothetical protein